MDWHFIVCSSHVRSEIPFMIAQSHDLFLIYQTISCLKLFVYLRVVIDSSQIFYVILLGTYLKYQQMKKRLYSSFSQIFVYNFQYCWKFFILYVLRSVAREFCWNILFLYICLLHSPFLSHFYQNIWTVFSF